MRYYAFLYHRECDTQPWPAIFESKERADNYIHRVSPVVEVCLNAQPQEQTRNEFTGIVTCPTP